jgi:hypothetical protein
MVVKMHHIGAMRRSLMRCLLALVALLLAGTTAVFLRTVSVWSAMMAFLVFLGMILTFLLGVFIGAGHVLPRRRRFNSPDMTILLGERKGTPEILTPRRHL